MGSGLPGQFGGRAGLTLARAEALDGDVQALAAGDGPQLTLVTIGDTIRPADLGHRARLLGEPLPTPPPSARPTAHLSSIGPWTGGRWAHAVRRASLLHAGGSKLTEHLSAGLRCRGVWGTDTGDPTGSGLAPVKPCPQRWEPRQHQAQPSPISQPAGPRARPCEHCPHLAPATPGLQEQSPVICSQSSRTAPRGSQLQAEETGWGPEVCAQFPHWPQSLAQPIPGMVTEGPARVLSWGPPMGPVTHGCSHSGRR